MNTEIRPPLDKSTFVQTLLSFQRHGVYQRRLVKLAYLAELAYGAEFGQRLSDAQYIRYDHGPYSSDILNSALEMPSDLVVIQTEESPRDPEIESTRFVPTSKCQPPNAPKLVNFFESFMRAHARQRTDVLVYEADRSAPFLGSSYGETIDFDSWIDLNKRIRESGKVRAQVELATKGRPHREFNDIVEFRDYLRTIRAGNSQTTGQ